MKILKEFKHSVTDLISVYTPWGSFHHDENQIRNKYYSLKKPSLNINHTSIIIMIDGRFIHGGLTDRIRGITTIYGYCKEKKIPFYINHTYPFLLQDYLAPNQYNWQILQDKISYNTNEAVPICLNSFALSNKYHRLYLDFIIKKHKGKQIHIYTSTRFLDCSFSQNFNELFKPTYQLQETIDKTIRYIGLRYTAMVFRFQQLLGDFDEPGYKTLTQPEQQKLINNCINKVVELYKQEQTESLILVTSDSITFLKAIAEKLEFVRIIPGKVVHMDHTQNATYNTYMKSFIDLFLLSKADKIYLLQTGDMYHSGFAQRAAMINNKPYKEIIF